MVFVAHCKNFLCLLFLIVSIFRMNAQVENTICIQDDQYEQLLNEKRKINTFLNITDCYKIQVFTGNSENAKKILNEFRIEFPNIDATIVFNTPNYKVWVGGFCTRIAAEKAFSEIESRFNNILLIKPKRL